MENQLRKLKSYPHVGEFVRNCLRIVAEHDYYKPTTHIVSTEEGDGHEANLDEYRETNDAIVASAKECLHKTSNYEVC